MVNAIDKIYLIFLPKLTKQLRKDYINLACLNSEYILAG